MACASHRSMAFVGKGEGFVDVGGPTLDETTGISAEAFEQAKREALAQRAAAPPPALPTIEGRDAGLRDALAALAAAPSTAAHLRVAAEYNRLRVRDMAYDHYSDALALDSRSAAALEGRARLLRDVGLMAMALADAHRARYFAPRSAEVRNTLGTILERRGFCVEALAQYRTALQLKPDAPWAAQNIERLTRSCS